MIKTVFECLCFLTIVLSIFAENAGAQKEEKGGKSSDFFPLFATQAKELILQQEEGSDTMHLVDEPLMRFSVGDSIFGSVFLWMDSDRRPAVIGTLE